MKISTLSKTLLKFIQIRRINSNVLKIVSKISLKRKNSLVFAAVPSLSSSAIITLFIHYLAIIM